MTSGSKSELRKEALAKRKALDEEEFRQLNKKLLTSFKTLDLAAVKSVHVFLPIVSKKEPDTFALINYLEEMHPTIDIVVSKSDFEHHLMRHFYYTGQEDLVLNLHQIPEPKEARPFEGPIEMVLVPLLAFDVKGNRVGYGKGFYDRFLENRQTVKVGISLFEALDEIKDVNLQDVALDFCVTPTRIYQF